MGKQINQGQREANAFLVKRLVKGMKCSHRGGGHARVVLCGTQQAAPHGRAWLLRAAAASRHRLPHHVTPRVSAAGPLSAACDCCRLAGYVWQTAENEWGHAVVLTALSVTDYTALTSKTILGELKVCVRT